MGTSQICESQPRLESRCAMLDAENLAGIFIVFLLKLAGLSNVPIPLATVLLRLVDDCKLPPLE